VRREFPHSGALDSTVAADAGTAHQHHPIFYGSYDWHSCVQQLLAADAAAEDLPGRWPMSPRAIRALVLMRQLTADKVAGELALFSWRRGRQGFEGLNGWAWGCSLAHEAILVAHGA